MPGEALVRVEDAPDNARRIFTGVDIIASVDDVWQILTDYEHLSDVIPNLVKVCGGANVVSRMHTRHATHTHKLKHNRTCI